MNNKTMAQNSSLLSSIGWLEKRAVRITIALFGLIVILVVMTLNVAKYETHLATGDTVLLELAPVDPRGFMQGDYMTLRYALENEVFAALNTDPDSYPTHGEGYVIVALDNNNVGQFEHLAESKPDNLSTNERAIYYRLRNGVLKLATNAFFFQEGHAEAFEAAEYGLFRVNDDGEPLLTNMVDEKFKVIDPKMSNPETNSLDNEASIDNESL